MPARLNFNVSEVDSDSDDIATKHLADSDNRFTTMLAAQASFREGIGIDGDEESIAANEKLSIEERKELLQKALNMAASNGDTERVKRLLSGKARSILDVNAPDEEGTSALIYASCFVC